MGERVTCFEDLDVFRRARSLTNEIYLLSRVGAFSRDFALCNQVRRATFEVPTLELLNS